MFCNTLSFHYSNSCYHFVIWLIYYATCLSCQSTLIVRDQFIGLDFRVTIISYTWKECCLITIFLDEWFSKILPTGQLNVMLHEVYDLLVSFAKYLGSVWLEGVEIWNENLNGWLRFNYLIRGSSIPILISRENGNCSTPPNPIISPPPLIQSSFCHDWLCPLKKNHRPRTCRIILACHCLPHLHRHP